MIDSTVCHVISQAPVQNLYIWKYFSEDVTLLENVIQLLIFMHII